MINESIVKKKNGVNPFLAIMNYKISAKTWIKHARIKIKKMHEKDREEARALGKSIESLHTSHNEEDDKPT